MMRVDDWGLAKEEGRRAKYENFALRSDNLELRTEH